MVGKSLFYLILFIFCSYFECKLEINKVIMRVPKENDYGLIFDLTVVNVATEEKDILQYQVRSDGTCTLNISDSDRMCDASRIVGGDFGYIKPSETDTVSLIWPTVSLYNRVGYCPIVIITMNEKNVEQKLMQNLYFDTRFETLDPEKRTLRKLNQFRDCRNYDKEYLNNCVPVDCEERYFGRRSFYNTTTEFCEPVPHCLGPNVFYDYIANECVDSMNFVTAEDIENIKAGRYSFLELKPWYYNLPDDNSTTTHECDEDVKLARDCDKIKPAVEKNNSLSFGTIPYWLKGVLSGLFIVLATIAIYLVICFCIFLIASWLSRGKCKKAAKSRMGRPNTPAEQSIPPSTPSLLSSHR